MPAWFPAGRPARSSPALSASRRQARPATRTRPIPSSFWISSVLPVAFPSPLYLLYFHYLAKKAFAARIDRAIEEIVRRGYLDDFAGLHEHNPIGHFPRKPKLVRNDNHGHSVLRKIDHDIEDFAYHLGVQRAGGLVEQHDLRLHGQGPGDGHPLLLPARQLGGMLVGLFRNAHPLEQLPRSEARRVGKGGVSTCRSRWAPYH